MNTRNIVPACVLVAAGLGAAATLFAGCQSGNGGPRAGDTLENMEVASADTGLSGAQLWAQTCIHCHNSRSPASYSDTEWNIVMNHMRQQAHLTGGQYRKILEFLQASN